MAPPELARHAPGLDVLQPLEIGLLPILRHEARAAFAHGFERRLRQRLGVDIPLVGEPRLEHRARAVAVRHHVLMVVDALEQPALLHHVDDALARRETVEPVEGGDRRREFRRGVDAFVEISIGGKRHLRLRIEHVDEPQPMPLADLEIVEVMRRGDFHRAGALLGIGIFVGDDRDQPADQRQTHALSDQRRIALVLRMHGDRRVAQHRLGPRRRDDDIFAGLFPGSSTIGYLKRHRWPFTSTCCDFEIGDRRVQRRVPVDETLVAVEQAVAIELNENLAHGARQAFIQREAFARPVAARRRAASAARRSCRRTPPSIPRRARRISRGRVRGDARLALRELALDDHLASRCRHGRCPAARARRRPSCAR